jgi:hypothetical protein
MMTVNSRSNVSRQDCLWEADDETPPMPQLRPESASAVRSNRSVVPGSQSLSEIHYRETEGREGPWINRSRSHQLTALSETRPPSPQSPSMLVSPVITEFQDRVKAMSST